MMSSDVPKIVLRIGSHAEKEYFEKLAKSLDAVMFGGNLLEITPAATSSLLFLLRTRRSGKPVPFYLDPITYCFGPYLDPQTGRIRSDMDSLKSERLIKRGEKARIRLVKDSYGNLAAALGDEFARAVGDGVRCRAVEVASLSEDSRTQMCIDVLDYQWNRVASFLAEDELMAEFVEEARPAALFAPYFFVSPSWADSGLTFAIDLAAKASARETRAPVHAVFCGSAELLESSEYVQRLVDGYRSTGAEGFWLWFDGFDEFVASATKLANFRLLVSGLAEVGEVYNLHGGFFSLLLAKDGLTGISHGVGYGERKPVAQVIGAAAPTVRYYLPPIRMRIGVPELQRSLQLLGITETKDYFSRVCDCQICRGILSRGIEQVSAFGEQHRASAAASRDSQTPAAAKMCRYHFLLNRLREPSLVAKIDKDQRSKYLLEASNDWRACLPLRPYLGNSESYIDRWARVLSGK